MSVLSIINNAATAVVRVTVGQEAASMYKDTSVAVGGAALTTTKVAVDLGVGVVNTVALALPASVEFLKGASIEVLRGSKEIEVFREELKNADAAKKAEFFNTFGGDIMRKVRIALKEEN